MMFNFKFKCLDSYIIQQMKGKEEKKIFQKLCKKGYNLKVYFFLLEYFVS